MRWLNAHDEAERAIARATRHLDQMRARLRDTTSEVAAIFETTKRELAEEAVRVETAEPPKGYTPVSGEDRLLAALRAPSVAGFAGRRDAVRAELDQLAIGELRVLRARIASPQAQDELASEIWKLGPTLRQEVSTFIENTDRRKARERVARARPTATSAPQPETADSRLRTAIEGNAVESDLLRVIATLAVTTRRSLATRLRTYRPGSGDDLAARFIRLEPTLRERIFMELAREPSRIDAVIDHEGPNSAQLATAITETIAKVTGKLTPVRKNPAEYLHQHTPEVWDVVGRYLQRVQFPAPSARLIWRDDVAFVAATVRQLRTMQLFERHGALLEVLYPSDPYVLLANLIPISDDWVPTIGSALAQLFEQAIVDSLQRLGPRWVELAEHRPETAAIGDETKSLVAASSLVASAPIDLAVRVGLTTSAVVALTETHKRSEHDGRVRTLRPVRLEWQGARERSMWNWVRAIDPVDPTVEEVAAELSTQRGGSASTEISYGLVASGSFFGVPSAWARQFHDAAEFAPVRDPSPPSTAAQLVTLASGTRADELALDAAHHGTRASGGSRDVVRTLGDVRAQLDNLHARFSLWQLGEQISVATHWVAHKQADLATASSHELATWAPIIADQKARLIRIAEAAAPLVNSKPNGGGKADPVRHVLTTYARAVATSFLGEASDRLVATATHEQQAITLNTLRASTNELAVVVGEGHGLDPKQLHRVEELASEARLMQTGSLAGLATDPEELERVMLSTQELTLHLRIEQIQLQLRALLAAAAQARQGLIATVVTAFPGKLQDLQMFGTEFANHLAMVHSAWDYDVSGASQIRDPDQYAQEMLRLRRTALARAQTRFAEIKNDDGLVTFLQSGAGVIERELRIIGFVTACIQMLALIGVGLVANAAGGAVAKAVMGWSASADAIEGVAVVARSARIASRVAGVATEAAVNTAGQRAVQGNLDGSTFIEGMAENALMSFGSELILTRIGNDLELAKNIERSTGSMWARTKTAGAVLLAKGVTISSHVIINAAVSYVAHQIVRGGHAEPSNATLSEWFMQGAAVGIGRYVHAHVSARTELYAKLAALHEFDQAKHLLRDATSLLDLATVAETAPTNRHALELLSQQRQLLTEELAVLEAAASDPAKLRALELTAPTVRGMKRFASSQLAELDAADLAELPLRSAHLEELIPGELWSGSIDQIHSALEAASRSGISAEATRGETGTWKIKIGQRTVRVREVEAVPVKPTSEPHRTGFSLVEKQQIVELDKLSHSLEEARTNQPERVADLEHQIAHAERALGIVGEGEVIATRRHAVEVQREVLADAPRRAARKRELDGEQGHPGVELHSHFMGIVEPEVFRQRAATAGGGQDTGSWQPLLDKIASLPALEAAHYRSAGKESYKSEYQHEMAGSVITHRAKAGDGVRIAVGAREQADQLTQRANETPSASDREIFLRGAETIAEEASRTALTSTPETPFDGAYVIIDALVKTTFGGARRAEESLATIEQRGFDDYIEQALLRLAETGTSYSEQSAGINKLAGKVSPERVATILERLIDEGRVVRGQIEIKLLGMVKTRNYGERDGDLPPMDHDTQSASEADTQNAKVLVQTQHPNTVGRDIGGPEAYTFNRAGADQYKRDYRAMTVQAAKTGHAIVDRPHVGEGSVDTEVGKPFSTDKDRILHGDKPAHYDRASENIEQLLTAAEELRAEGVWDPTKVITRYGHATHATPQQAARMRTLGIIAEINLGSNVVTGSLSQTEGPHGSRATRARYQDHALPSLIYYEASVILSTDGPAVMTTTLAAEYGRASQIIEAVLAGEQPVRISITDAASDGQVRGTTVTEHPDQRELFVDEMTSVERVRFLTAYEKLFADAQQYLLRRPKPAGPSRHHTTLAIEHGLTSTLGEAQFSGSSTNVRAAANAYRAAGYMVVGDDARSNETRTVVVSIEQFTTTLVAIEESPPYTRSVTQ